ncbi:MAG: septum formation protein Maf [Chloroflexi bacterium]|nr:septum formation protein Maf [Chloroflexota bacterium]
MAEPAARDRIPLVLASASPRRRQLVALLKRPYQVAVADIDESPADGEEPALLAQRLAVQKAQAVAAHLSSVAEAGPDVAEAGPAREDRAVVLAADTIVVLDDTILNKPADQQDALLMLTGLRGRDHRVLTGVALTVAGQVAWSSVVETTVWMRRYELPELARYIATGSPLDKAGGYGIQDVRFRPVERIDGCYSNVVGLPLCEVDLALRHIDAQVVNGGSVTAIERGVVQGSCGPLCEAARRRSARRRRSR